MSNIRPDDTGLVQACASCGQKNRLPYDKLGAAGRCGKCGADLAPPAEPIDADSDTHFQALINKSALPIVVDFWAPWCAPCRMVAPEIAKVAEGLAGKVLVAKVNTEALPALGARYGISSIPTMAVFAGGREIARAMGARPAPAIEAWVRSALSAAPAR